jgi:hypothetical protein
MQPSSVKVKHFCTGQALVERRSNSSLPLVHYWSTAERWPACGQRTGEARTEHAVTVQTAGHALTTRRQVEYAGFDNRPGTDGRYDPSDQTSRAYL